VVNRCSWRFPSLTEDWLVEMWDPVFTVFSVFYVPRR
jgi:hypothetical protein